MVGGGTFVVDVSFSSLMRTLLLVGMSPARANGLDLL